LTSWEQGPIVAWSGREIGSSLTNSSSAAVLAADVRSRDAMTDQKPTERLAFGKAAVPLVPILLIAGLSLLSLERNSLWRSAIPLWQDSVRKSPAKSRPHMMLGLSYDAAERFADAEQELFRAIERDDRNVDAANILGMTYLKQGRIQDAERMVMQALLIAPDYPDALNHLGIVRANQQRYEEAHALFEKVVGMKPDFAEGHNNRGLVSLLQGDAQRAIGDFERALALDPRSGTYRRNLEQARERLRNSSSRPSAQ
jgi:tetratricopeptide (TPR) repeat protein